MNNSILQIKVKQRLNKLDSQDYDNIQCWQIVEAFNKGQVEWCRRQLHGANAFREGDEQSKRRVDDLQILLTPLNLTMLNRITFWQGAIPDNYFEWKRISVYAKNDCCTDPVRMVVYLTEEANVDELLRDKNKQPNFEWAETFVTMQNGNVLVYTDNKFDIHSAELTYYRQPRKIQIANCLNPYTGTIPTVDVECEFKDDVTELMIDETVSIIAGDIESGNQYQRGNQSTEKNN